VAIGELVIGQWSFIIGYWWLTELFPIY